MKRIQLFEFEDLPWFPRELRDYLTHYIVTIHRLMNTPAALAPLVARLVSHAKRDDIVDLCSGGGGPWADTLPLLESAYQLTPTVTLTDLYPNATASKTVNSNTSRRMKYRQRPTDAGNVPKDLNGPRTLICSFHHMPPPVAQKILADAVTKRAPILIFEISDNSHPKFLWWLAIITAFISVFFLTPFVRPLTWKQILLTYVVPILPLVIAWDGAVSNARTYTPEDLREMLDKIPQENYLWDIGTVKPARAPGKMLYVLGLPN